VFRESHLPIFIETPGALRTHLVDEET
jgi:hypothetical protein